MISAKNATVPGSMSSSLGFGMGDDLLSQVEQQMLLRQKKTMAVPGQAPAAYGAQGFGVSTQPGAGGMSPAILGLLGQGGFQA
jgi:hypothetical protein